MREAMVDVRAYVPDDIAVMTTIWNEVVMGGVAFHHEDGLDPTDVADPGLVGIVVDMGIDKAA